MPFFCQRNVKEERDGGNEREGETNQERGLPRRKTRRSDFPSGDGLRTWQIRASDHTTEILCCWTWGRWHIQRCGSRNLGNSTMARKRHDALGPLSGQYSQAPNAPFTVGCFLRPTDLLLPLPQGRHTRGQPGSSSHCLQMLRDICVSIRPIPTRELSA